jgi:hypothetical protein
MLRSDVKSLGSLETRMRFSGALRSLVGRADHRSTRPLSYREVGGTAWINYCEAIVVSGTGYIAEIVRIR